jgi:hypothetical protein
MYDTTLMLKPREQWPAGMTYEKLIQQMDEKLQIPGLSNTWTSPVENRLDMELIRIKTPLGMKVRGPNEDGSAGGCREQTKEPPGIATGRIPYRRSGSTPDERCGVKLWYLGVGGRHGSAFKAGAP